MSDSVSRGVAERYERAKEALREQPATWLVTGAAGFIGSHLVEHLLGLGQRVVGLDDLSAGFLANLDDVREAVGEAWNRFRFVEGDIRDLATCRAACSGVDYVLHEAALCSVPWSIDDPLLAHEVNVTGFVHILQAAREAGVRRVVYAASSAAYGDETSVPAVEERIGRPLSPYAANKYIDEVYADVFGRSYGLESVGLRYFNVFGRRQDPAGAYAAVIPCWVANLLAGRPCQINGDGETTRDFCHVENVVQANLLAATAPAADIAERVFNVACGEQTTLNQLFAAVRDGLARHHPELAGAEPLYAEFRPGDVRHSMADISRIRRALGYAPTHDVRRGLADALDWYAERLREPQPAAGRA